MARPFKSMKPQCSSSDGDLAFANGAWLYSLKGQVGLVHGLQPWIVRFGRHHPALVLHRRRMHLSIRRASHLRPLRDVCPLADETFLLSSTVDWLHHSQFPPRPSEEPRRRSSGRDFDPRAVFDRYVFGMIAMSSWQVSMRGTWGGLSWMRHRPGIVRCASGAHTNAARWRRDGKHCPRPCCSTCWSWHRCGAKGKVGPEKSSRRSHGPVPVGLVLWTGKKTRSGNTCAASDGKSCKPTIQTPKKTEPARKEVGVILSST